MTKSIRANFSVKSRFRCLDTRLSFKGFCDWTTPGELFSATQKEDFISFNQLCENGHKIKYKKWCPEEEREVQWSEIKKGY
jgi:non-homologous end joining protein Ku